MYSNIITPDCCITNYDRADRAIALGQDTTSYLEHGTTGRFIEGIEIQKRTGLKPLIGTEAYFVKNRKEKDNTNAHLVLIAKNENGRKAINRALSEANLTGYYYKPRFDLELVLNLPKEDVWCTSACCGGVWKYDKDAEELIKNFHNHFGYNFFLEVQNHNTPSQKILNKEIIRLSRKHNINLIAGMDSHMIYPEQTQERDDYLASRGIHYADEENWYMDFPSYDEAYKRFKSQDILNDFQIEQALDNTNIFSDVEKYNSPIFDKETIKLPTLFPNKTQEEKNQILHDLVMKKWEEEKVNIPDIKHPYYEQEINKELDVVYKTNMADYFLLDYEIIRKGKEMGGSITLTGRGSSPSFYLSKLLQFSTIDRIASPIKLFPERFISTERLLETKSLPDIDFNLGTPEIFYEAQQKILGNGHAYQMIAYGTVKALSAWKIYARVADLDFDTANYVSSCIKSYQKDLLHAESRGLDPEEINELDYIDKDFHDVFLESKKYLGMVNSVTPHPCASLIWNDGDLREEFGLIKIKTGKIEHICVNCDGYLAEDYKFLKNDLLKVSVVDLIHRVYKRIGIEPHPLPELVELCDGDEKVWEIYKNAWTMGINQVEQHGSAGRVAKYAPQNISELSAFIAAIRPGFQSYYQQFENREPYKFGVETLDSLIQTREFPHSYMLYQENVMQVMAYAGIPISETYDAIKNIAKKRAEKVYTYRDQFIDGMTKRLIENEKISEKRAKEISDRTWQVIEDSARYNFNAAHAYSMAGDSLYGAYLKSHYPLEFYEVFLNILEEDGDKDRLSKARKEAESAFGIHFPPFKFGQDNRSIVADKEKNIITASLQSIKYMGSNIGEDLYELYQNFDGEDFVDLMILAEEKHKFSKKWEKLIKINYFREFGGNKKLMTLFEEFRQGDFRYSHKYTDKTKKKRIAGLKKLQANLPNESLNFSDQLAAEEDILGYIHYQIPDLDKGYVYVLDLDTRYAPRFQGYCLSNGRQESLKIYNKTFDEKPFEDGAILFCRKFEKKPKITYINGNYVEDLDADPQWWLLSYDVVPLDEFENISKKYLTNDLK
jgi:DNA polymerase III alpha subunit